MGKDGNMICEEDKSNQKYFYVKEDTNNGIKEYLEEYIALMGNGNVEESKSIEEKMYYYILENNCIISKDVLQGFFFDNDMVGSQEIQLEV